MLTHARRILVPYHHADALKALAGLTADDVVVVSKGPAGAMVARIMEQTAARVAAATEPVTVVSGDDTTALATVAGLQRRGVDPGVLWLSARGGLHTAHTTRTGDLSGMALAMLTGRTGSALAQSVGLRPVAGEACALVGTRALDAEERDAARDAGIRRIELGALVDAALPPAPWYVHLDVDLIDSDEVPPLRAPVPGGASVPAVAAALRTLRARGDIAALGLACTFTERALREPETPARIASLAEAICAPG